MDTDDDRRVECPVCARRLAPDERALGVCADARCRRVWLEERPRRQQVLASQGRALRDAHAAEAGIDAPEAFPVVVVPTFGRAATRLPKARRRAFAAHLARLIADAVALRDAAPTLDAAPPVGDGADLAAVIGHACAGCGGHCCREGGDHAYLTGGVMRRYLAAHPTATPSDVLAAYARAIPPVTMRRSCIYHAPDGCGLPRALRSDTCNRYFCEGLQRFRDDHQQHEGPVRAFVAQIADDARGDVRRGAFVDARDVRVVRRSR